MRRSGSTNNDVAMGSVEMNAMHADRDEVKEAEMKALFRRLHALYVDTTSNPFHEPNSELYKCASFGRQVERIVEAGLY